MSLPPRSYELAGRLLAEAADRSRTEGTDIVSALRDVTHLEGHRLADEIHARLQGSGGEHEADRRRTVLDVLEEHGFEPRLGEDGTVVLRNCPFHHLARQHTELICGMNLSLLSSAVETVDGTGLDARLEPEPDPCCVKLHVNSTDTRHVASDGEHGTPPESVVLDDAGDQGGDPACWAHLFDD